MDHWPLHTATQVSRQTPHTYMNVHTQTHRYSHRIHFKLVFTDTVMLLLYMHSNNCLISF